MPDEAPRVGETAPPLALPDLNGVPTSLVGLRGRPVLVSFLRHAGCLICRAHLAKILDRRERLDAAGAGAVFVVYDDPAFVRQTMLAGLDVPFPVLVDRSRAAYAAWGLERASLARIWGDPRVWVRYFGVALSGHRPTRFGTDTLQLGGDFVVDRGGALAYARPQRTDDRPPVARLLAAIEESART